MQNYLLSLLINHLLSEFEQELTNNGPALVAITVKEIELFIKKLENLLSINEPVIAQVVNPVLDKVDHAVVAGVEAVGNAALNNQ